MALADALWFIVAHKNWAQDLYMKCRCRAAHIVHAFVSWYSVDVLTLPCLM